MPPNWLPDWQKEEEYPAPSDISLDEWAWEFLRRNPDYQADYAHFNSLPDSDPDVGVKNGKWKGSPCMDGALDNFYCDPAALKGETYREYETRHRLNGVDDWTVVAYAQYLTSHYKIEPTPLDPKEPLKDYIQFSDMFSENSLPPWVIMDKSPEAILYYEERSTNIIAFNFNYPIEPQIDLAKEYLLDARQMAKNIGTYNRVDFRNTTKKFPLYLRLLDAEAAGASIQEMASVLFPHEDNSHPDYRVSKKISYQLKRAVHLRDGGYWLIPQ